MDLYSLPTHLQGKRISEQFGTKTSIYRADILPLGGPVLGEKHLCVSSKNCC